MDAMQFIAALVGSLAWPITLAVIVFWLRDPVKQLITLVSSLKYKDIQVDFGREVQELETKAKSIGIDTSQTPRTALPNTSAKDSETRGTIELLSEAERLADDFPEPAVAVAWSAVEDELANAVLRMAVSPDYPLNNSPLRSAELLVSARLLDPEVLNIVKRMRNLRNAAVHGGSFTTVTDDEAREFIWLAKYVIRTLRALQRDKGSAQ